MLGIIYNKEGVAPEDVADKSWDLMWNEKYAGNILQFNNSRDAFATAQYRLGLDVNSDNKAEWQTALNELKKQQPLIKSYCPPCTWEPCTKYTRNRGLHCCASSAPCPRAAPCLFPTLLTAATIVSAI